MYKAPPLIKTSMAPWEIVGPGNMDTFREFFAIASSPTSGGEFPRQRLKKEIGEEILTHIAATLAELRSHGFYPVRSESGDLEWKVVTKTAVQVEFEKGLPPLQGKSVAELRQLARQGYKGVVESCKVDDVEPWEIGYEKQRVA